MVKPSEHLHKSALNLHDVSESCQQQRFSLALTVPLLFWWHLCVRTFCQLFILFASWWSCGYPAVVFCPFLAPLPSLSFTLCCRSFRRGILTCCPPLCPLNELCICNAMLIFLDSCTPQRSPLLNLLSYIAFLQTAASLLPVRLLQMTRATALAEFLATSGSVLANQSFPHMVRLLLLLKGILQQPVHCGAVRNMCLIIKIYVLCICHPWQSQAVCVLC